MLYSDGRVSENTTTLIRRLLVLEPSQRMTAAEVLDSLSVNIATTKSLLAPLEPLQVNTVQVLFSYQRFGERNTFLIRVQSALFF